MEKVFQLPPHHGDDNCRFHQVILDLLAFHFVYDNRWLTLRYLHLISLQIQTVFWQQMSVDLNLTTSQLNNAQSGNLAGLAVGCIFFIPFTVKYGRRLVYIISICVLAAATWWTARIQSFAELMCTSVICGLAGAINETAVQMTVS